MTTDSDRLRFLETVDRLQAWVRRTKRPPAEFIRANRALFDELIQPVVIPLAPKPPKPRRQPRRWRHWRDLSATEQARLITKMRRRQATRGIEYNSWGATKEAVLDLTRRHIIVNSDDAPPIARMVSHSVNRYGRYPTWAGFPSYTLTNRHLHDSTPADRVYKRRLAHLKQTISVYDGGSTFDDVQPVFIPGLHPDDVEFSPTSIVVSREIKQLRQLFTEIRQPLTLGSTIEEWPLAASLFMTDAGEQVEVYYCALLTAHRSAPPTLDRAYVARAFDLSIRHWRVSARFKRASNALAAGLKLYGEGVAQHIHQPSAEEGAPK